MFSTIVVPLSFDEEVAAAVPHGAALARQAGAALELLTMRPSYVDAVSVRSHLADIAQRHRVEARLEVAETGDVAAVLAEVAKRPDTLLCLQTPARRSLGELALGSVSERVLRSCDQPMLLIGPRCGNAPERFALMVVGLDGSDLAEQILPVVVEWSSRLDVTPWLFEVLPARVPLELGAGDVHETAYVHRIADRLAEQGVKAAWETAHDRHPAAAVARFAEGRQSSLIALTTHGRSGLGRLALGSVALEVAHHATVPVLVLRPPAPMQKRSET